MLSNNLKGPGMAQRETKEPNLCTTWCRKSIQARIFGGTFDQILWSFCAIFTKVYFLHFCTTIRCKKVKNDQKSNQDNVMGTLFSRQTSWKNWNIPNRMEHFQGPLHGGQGDELIRSDKGLGSRLNYATREVQHLPSEGGGIPDKPCGFLRTSHCWSFHRYSWTCCQSLSFLPRRCSSLNAGFGRGRCRSHK